MSLLHSFVATNDGVLVIRKDCRVVVPPPRNDVSSERHCEARSNLLSSNGLVIANGEKQSPILLCLISLSIPD